MVVDWLKPGWLKLGLLTGNMKTPVPPRKTVLLPRGVQAKPRRGLNILDWGVKMFGFEALANSGPPSTLNWLAGITSGFRAYAFCTCVAMGLGVVPSKPLMLRLYRSVLANSRSNRSPRFTDKLLLTRQSSCTNSARYLVWLVRRALISKEPLVGIPKRKAARSCPTGAEVELSAALVQFVPNVYTPWEFP